MHNTRIVPMGCNVFEVDNATETLLITANYRELKARGLSMMQIEAVMMEASQILCRMLMEREEVRK